MSDPLNFDPKTAVVVQPDSICVMTEIYCDAQGSATKTFPLKDADGKPTEVIVDSVSGTLSFYGLNWSWWKRLSALWNGGSTAICGWIGTQDSNLLAFDLQGRGSRPINIPVNASFSALKINAVSFNLLADLTLPTDFRAALIFHRRETLR